MKPRDADWYHYLPDEVKEILSRLKSAGHITYVVGGAVRDLLLGIPPKDFDLVSNAKPEEISALFSKTLEIGKQFGISMVVLNDKPIEVAAFRKESTYSDGRRPDKVEYATPEEDAKRRDFTINGIFWDPENKKIIDYVGGQEDLEKKRIRCIGDANERFHEDALRMMRALRFFSLLKPLGFSLDSKVIDSIKQNKARIGKVSRERITQELELLLKTQEPEAGLQIAVDSGLWSEMFPGAVLDRANLGMLSNILDNTGKSRWIALALSVSDSEKFLAKLILGQDVKAAIQFTKTLKDKKPSSLAEKKELMNNDHFIAAAEAIGAKDLLSEKEKFSSMGTLNPLPLLSGEDMKNIGFSPGKEMGIALHKVRKAQLNEEIASKEEAIALAKKLLP